MLFFCVADDDYYEDDEEDDPDALKDPIYQIDLQVHSFWILFVLTTLISRSSVKKSRLGKYLWWFRIIKFSL